MTLPRTAAGIVAAAALALSLAACSSEPEQPAEPPAASEAEATSPAPEEAPAEEPEGDELQAVVDALGVTDYEQSPDIAPHATQWGEGTFEGTRVQVYEFEDDGAYEAFIEQVSQFGIVESQLTRSGNIVVSVDDQTKTAEVRDRLAQG